MAEMYVDSRLNIKDYTNEMLLYAKEKLIFNNPKYIKAEALGLIKTEKVKECKEIKSMTTKN